MKFWWDLVGCGWSWFEWGMLFVGLGLRQFIGYKIGDGITLLI